MSDAPLLPASSSAPRLGHQREYRQRSRFKWNLLRLILPASVVAAFLLFVFTLSVLDETHRSLPSKQPGVEFPDFSNYNKFVQTLPQTYFPSHPNDNKRVIAIGDIHAMNQSLSALLAEISYDPQSDTLIHLGDLVPKSKKLSPNPVLSFMSKNRVLGVRGNNDQTAIEWRTWMSWIITLPGGKEWLEDVDSGWSHIDGDVSNAEFDAWLKNSHKQWEAYVPSGWKLLGKHYKTARDLSQAHYDYLCSLPLVLYAPAAHTYFVHAGVLAADPTRKLDDPKQPLSHWPATASPEDDELVLRGLQETALLNEIPQNQDPWVVMNMRSLTKKGTVKDGQKGTPWSDLWNDIMNGCSGSLADSSADSSTTRTPLDCFPSTVIYGHAAARDLDVKRWSVGLDTGCAAGHRLTAIVLDAKSLSPQTFDASSRDSYIPYGDEGMAQITSVKCHT